MIFDFNNFSSLKAHFQVFDTFKNNEECFLFHAISSFCSQNISVFGHVAKWLDKKNKVNFKFYDFTAWLANNCNTHTWETFSLKNRTQNVLEKLVPDPFLKNKNWAYLWINSWKFYTVCFYCMPSWGLSKYIETRLQTIYFYLILSNFKKIKRCLELVSLPYFLHNFSRKIFLLLYSINWSSFIVWLPLICEILGNMCLVFVY